MSHAYTRVVHRTEFPLATRTRLQLPGFTRAIAAGPLRTNRYRSEHTRPMCELWYESVDDLDIDVDVFIVGTGNHIIPERAIHLATWIDGAYVWHAYVEYPVQAVDHG